ncbi:MAG: hypothetical protein A4E65_00670 [Syntrophorhabdus sp. PtaU1.Bin153]|nr:MAG: hypothetical protein A4E65_00670 [Syntrophorhabdus sp. PtaU1.Bin153]
MKKNFTIIALIIMIGTFFGGCTTSRVEMDYGTSYKIAKFNQTFDPDAEKNLDPVLGIDGRAAEKIMDNYYKSFEKPAQPMPTLMMNVSGGGK